jgi:hypothetical protein
MRLTDGLDDRKNGTALPDLVTRLDSINGTLEEIVRKLTGLRARVEGHHPSGHAAEDRHAS